MFDVTPEENRLESLAGLGVGVKTSSLWINIARILTSSTEYSTTNHGTLRVTVEDKQGIRALGIVLGDLPDAVDGTFLDGRAVRDTKSAIKDDIHVVAGDTLGLELCASSIAKWRGASVVIWSIVSAGHEDGYIDTIGGELWRGSALCTGERKGGKDNSGKALPERGC